MDPASLWISFFASIGTILQLSGEVVQYIKDAKGAPTKRQDLLHEIDATANVLRRFEVRAKRDDCKSALEVLNRPLEQHQDLLNKLKAKLQPAHTTLRGIVTHATWHFSENEINKMVSRMERFKSLFNHVLAMECL